MLGLAVALIAAGAAVTLVVLALFPPDVPVPAYPAVSPRSQPPAAEWTYRPPPGTTPWGPRLTDDPGTELDSP